jgi:RNA polymerase sigma-70 factor (ECF subfamily)
VSVLIGIFGDIDIAEEAVQDAFATAAQRWPEAGLPPSPAGWIITTARNRAIDRLRRESTRQDRYAQAALLNSPEEATEEGAVCDDRLRLIFTCCHPALVIEAQVALTLRMVCGLSTADVARGFLVPEPTMAARITRAKKKISDAHIPYRIPTAPELPARVEAVLSVVYLVFTTGHTAPFGASLMRRDLAERAHELARMLRMLLPADRDVVALLALILLTDARRDARIDASGRLVLLADQDRSRWDHPAISEGIGLLHEALGHRAPSRFALMAAIAAVHDEAREWDDTDWPEIVGLYDLLLETWPSPVVALNRAIAVGFAVGPAEGLSQLDMLAAEPQLARYGYLSAARADFLKRLGRTSEAKLAYEEAVILTENVAEREFLLAKLENQTDEGQEEPI